MKSKYEQRTEHVLDDKDYFYVGYDHFDETIDFSIHSQRNDVTRYSMTQVKFLRSLQLCVEDFDKNNLEIMKKVAAILFGQIRKIEEAEAKAELEETEEKVTI